MPAPRHPPFSYPSAGAQHELPEEQDEEAQQDVPRRHPPLPLPHGSVGIVVAAAVPADGNDGC